MIRSNNYIGVTGFKTNLEVQKTLCAVKGLTPKYDLMCGVLASYKTLKGEPPGNPNRYPSIKDISKIFREELYLVNLIHYNSKHPGLDDQLSRLVDIGGYKLDGFQLNIPFPNATELTNWRKKFSNTYNIVLQINHSMLNEVNRNVKKLVERLKPYEGLATNLLLDLSGGRGTELDLAFSIKALKVLKKKLPWAILGVAGGLGPTSHEVIGKLNKSVPNLSFDSESRVRNTDDTLNTELCNDYLRCFVK